MSAISYPWYVAEDIEVEDNKLKAATAVSEAQKRSVDNLQRLYAIVVSLAMAEVLTHVFNRHTAVSIFEAAVFLSIVVPFYHGAHRYLDDTYVLGLRSAKSFALILDFWGLFIEALLLFLLALLVESEWFFIILLVLLLWDTCWVGLTQLTAASTPLSNEVYKKPFHYAWWAILNGITIVLVFFTVFSRLISVALWNTDNLRIGAACGLVVVRTVLDYILVWDFYYPGRPEVHEPSGQV